MEKPDSPLDDRELAFEGVHRASMIGSDSSSSGEDDKKQIQLDIGGRKASISSSKGRPSVEFAPASKRPSQNKGKAKSRPSQTS